MEATQNSPSKAPKTARQTTEYEDSETTWCNELGQSPLEMGLRASSVGVGYWALALRKPNNAAHPTAIRLRLSAVGGCCR